MKIAGLDIGKRRVAISTFMISASGTIDLINTVSLFVHPTLRAAELHHLTNLTLRYAEGMDWTYAFIEEPPVGRGGVRVSMDLQQTVGALASGITGLGVHTELVNVQAWKKAVIGSGNASKHDVVSHINRTYPLYSDFCGNDQDQYDAVCIGLYGCGVLLTANDLALSGSLSEPVAP